MEDFLKKMDLKFDDLRADERDTYLRWLDDISKKQLTLDKVLLHMRAFITAIEKELAKEPEFIYQLGGLIKRENRSNIFMKARLSNYLLIESMLTSPARAKEALQQALGNVKTPKI